MFWELLQLTSCAAPQDFKEMLVGIPYNLTLPDSMIWLLKSNAMYPYGVAIKDRHIQFQTSVWLILKTSYRSEYLKYQHEKLISAPAMQVVNK